MSTNENSSFHPHVALDVAPGSESAGPALASPLKGRWLPAILASLYFLSLLNPPIALPDLKWYFVFGLAVYAFLSQKSPINLHTARPFWIVYGLSYFGAVLSLLRADNLDLALWNTVGMAVSFVSFLLFLPVLATRHARKIFLAVLVGNAISWAIQIQLLLARYGTLYLGTFGDTGENKNNIGISLSLATVALFYIVFSWKPAKTMPKWWSLTIRVAGGLLAIFLAYSMVLIVARSNVLATIIGSLAVIGLRFVQSKKWVAGLQASVIITIITALIIILIPNILTASPEWNRLDSFESQGFDVIGTYDIRVVLLQKGLYLVGQNPFLGVGIGGSRASVDSGEQVFPHFVIHNTYLTNWAEKGILGLLSDVVLIFIYLQFLQRKFFVLPVIDQIWLVLLIPLFFVMSFMDLGSISVTLLLVLSGIIYEQTYLEQPKSVLQPLKATRVG